MAETQTTTRTTSPRAAEDLTPTPTQAENDAAMIAASGTAAPAATAETEKPAAEPHRPAAEPARRS